MPCPRIVDVGCTSSDYKLRKRRSRGFRTKRRAYATQLNRCVCVYRIQNVHVHDVHKARGFFMYYEVAWSLFLYSYMDANQHCHTYSRPFCPHHFQLHCQPRCYSLTTVSRASSSRPSFWLHRLHRIQSRHTSWQQTPGRDTQTFLDRATRSLKGTLTWSTMISHSRVMNEVF